MWDLQGELNKSKGMLILKKNNLLKKSIACASAAAMLLTASPAVSVNAAVTTPGQPNNYDNFAEALQLALCFYDANKCGDEVAEDGYYSWRGDCHVKDGVIPLQPMDPMPKVNSGKPVDDEKPSDVD